MIQELLEKERRYINYFFDHLDLESSERLFEAFKQCRGVIVFTGVGKSGLVAQKIAATMTSTNSRALFLSPTDALHGDIGIVGQNDLFVFLSKSGESDELIAMLPSLRNKGAKTAAIVSNSTSRLAKACDLVMELPVEKELCPFDMAPTISTTVQMLFGDLLAIALMQEKKFTLDDYALNHPAGRIGKRITVKVGDLMITGGGVPLCKEGDKLVDILVELSNKRCGCILIADDEGKLCGIFTDGDLRRTLQSEGAEALQKQMRAIMISSPKTIGPEALATKAISIMEGTGKGEVTVLPVVDEEKKIVGLIKLHDIVQSGI